MTSSILIGLIHNAALLLLLGAIYNVSVRNYSENRSKFYQTAWGTLIGGMSIVLMLTPVKWMPGIVFDTRTILLSVTGLFFGPLTTLIAMAIAGVYRFLLGGGGAAMGVSTIISSSLIGLAWRHYRSEKLLERAPTELLLLGVAVHVVMIISMFLLPPEAIFNAIKTLSLPVITIYPIATMLLGLFIVNLQKQHWTERELDISNRKYMSFMKSATDGIYILNKEGKLVEANEAFFHMLGYNEEPAASLHVWDWDKQFGRDGSIQKIKELIASPALFESVHRKKNGLSIDVEVNASGIKLGDEWHLYAASRDISRRKTLETSLRSSQQQLSDIFEFLPDATFVIDADMKVIAWNKAMEKMTGIASSKIIGEGDYAYSVPLYGTSRKILIDLLDLNADELRAQDSNIDRRGNNLFVETFCPALYGGKGAYIWAVAASLYDLSGERIGAIETIRDISALKAVEADLIRSNNEQQQLTNLIYHELQEPLRQIMGSAQLLTKRYTGKLDGDADEFISFIIDGSNRMKSQIEDLLAYFKIDSEHTGQATVESDNVLVTVMASLEEQIRESGGQITHDETLPRVMIAEDMLAIIFYNLLSNSLKFRRDEPPAIHIGVQRTEETVTFSIIDNGLGIALEDREKIFLLFKRLHHRSDYPGSGIGLAVCKRIVEQQHGRIWFESTLGQGSTFYFTLPSAENINHVK